MASGRVPKMTLIFTQGGDEYLVLCLLNGWCFAARDFRSRRGASDEHIPKWICKERATKPGPKRPAALRVAPRLACGFVARRSQPHFGGCSLLAPRHRPNWAQQNTSHFGDTTLDQLSRLVHTIQTIPSALRQHGRVSFFTPTSRGGCDSKPCQTVAGGGAER